MHKSQKSAGVPVPASSSADTAPNHPGNAGPRARAPWQSASQRVGFAVSAVIDAALISAALVEIADRMIARDGETDGHCIGVLAERIERLTCAAMTALEEDAGEMPDLVVSIYPRRPIDEPFHGGASLVEALRNEGGAP